MANDVFVLVEHLGGTVSEITFELIDQGRPLAARLGGRLVAVLLGSGAESLAGELGAADVVLSVDHPALEHYTPEAYTRALAALLKTRDARVLLVGSTTIGMDQAAGLSVALGWPLVAYARAVDAADGALDVVSLIYGGKILAESQVRGDHAIVAVLAGASPAVRGQAAGSPPVERVEAGPLDALRLRFRRLIQPEAGDVDITKEAILVSVGRGIQGQDNLPLAEELAQALGGVLSASRPIVDQGWLPKSRQVGKSGMTVKPKLYLAVGISGAPEHLEGMRGAETIIAINTDAAAPIFNVAHYGIVGDLFEIVPSLTEKLRSAS